MKARIIITAALLSMHLAPTSVFSQSSVKGVWKGLEFHFHGTDTASFVWKEIQPCLYMFTERHYSVVYVEGTKPRAIPPEGTTKNNASCEQLRAAITPFVANSGTYEVNSDTTLIVYPLVALWPTTPGQKRTVNYKVEKDALTVSGKNPKGSWELRFSRLE